MATTYVKIGSTVTVGSGGAASIDFTSIPSTYTDLVIKCSLRNNIVSTYGVAFLVINGATTNRTLRMIEGGDGTTASYSISDARIALTDATNSTASTFSSTDIYIPNYTSSNNKSLSSDTANEGNAANGYYMQLIASLWSQTAAITSLSLTTPGNSFVQYSTASLYGISKS
jgi:hypothetical protein